MAVVVSYNSETAAKQAQVLQRHVQEATTDLLAVHWSRVRHREKKVDTILAHHRVHGLLRVTFVEKEAQISLDPKARDMAGRLLVSSSASPPESDGVKTGRRGHKSATPQDSTPHKGE